jgi:hypothetical protein
METTDLAPADPVLTAPIPAAPIPAAVPADPTSARRHPWVAPGSAFAGASLTVLALYAAVQSGAIDAVANIRTPPAAMVPATPDSRVERLVKLLESERDCDSDCLANLRGRADKSLALEQALSHLQEAATTAEQRRAAIEGEKAALFEEMNRKLAKLDADYKQQLATLESEKTGLAGQWEKRAAELEAKQTQEVAALDAEKTALTAQLEKKAALAEAGYQKKMAALEQRLADTEARLKTAMTRPEPSAWRKGKSTVPAVAEPAPQAAPVPVAAAPATPPPATPTDASQWTVLGMTATTVVVSTANHRLVALAVGETLDGVKIERIDVAQGVAETSAGNLTYHQ